MRRGGVLTRSVVTQRMVVQGLNSEIQAQINFHTTTIGPKSKWSANGFSEWAHHGARGRDIYTVGTMMCESRTSGKDGRSDGKRRERSVVVCLSRA